MPRRRWDEIFAAMRVRKMWALGCTISIETASDTWHLLRAYAELCDFATALARGETQPAVVSMYNGPMIHVLS